jgi:hypothetical protein
MQEQFVIDTEPTAEEDPDGHAEHALVPVRFEYVPAGHAAHVLELLAPATLENAPAGHGTQTPEEFAAVTSEYAPAGQETHALDPVTVLYLPAAHAVQVPPFAPVYPASQAQLVRNPLALAAREFAGHKLQFGLPSGDHSPSPQLKHVSLPVAP